jgi:hypothetical protein
MATFQRKYLSVDPGGVTTGLCVVLEKDTAKQRFQIATDNWPMPKDDPHRQLFNRIADIHPSHIILERYQHRPNQPAADNRAGEYCGVVQLYAQTMRIPCTLQNSSVVGKTAFFGDDNRRVKQLGLYNHKASPHGMDALRHFLYYISFTVKSRYFIQELPRDED